MAGLWGIRGKLREPACLDVVVHRLERGDRLRGEWLALAGCAHLAQGFEQRGQFKGPRLPLLLMREFQLPQQMRVTQSVFAPILKT